MASRNGTARLREVKSNSTAGERGPKLPPHASEAAGQSSNWNPSPALPVILLTEEIVPTQPIASAFAAFIERGDTRALLEVVAHNELEHLSNRPPPSNALREMFLGRINSPYRRAREILRQMTELQRAGTAVVSAGNELNRARIQQATTQQQYEFERTKREAEIAREQRRKVEAEVAIQELNDEAEVRRAERAARIAEHRWREAAAEAARADLRHPSDMRGLERSNRRLRRAVGWLHTQLREQQRSNGKS
jgi:hypothetical protein